MFTGIIESKGMVSKILTSGSNKSFWIRSPISSQLNPDQSVSHDGVCLTVENIKEGQHLVTAVRETLEKTSLDDWTEGTEVNLECCMILGERLDGHLVQGHVDSTGIIEKIKSKK